MSAASPEQWPSPEPGATEPTGRVPDGAIRHPLVPNAYYVGVSDGTVSVAMGSRWGRFRRDGRWIEGTLFEADPEMCVWVSAPRPSAHHRISRVVDMPSER